MIRPILHLPKPVVAAVMQTVFQLHPRGNFSWLISACNPCILNVYDKIVLINCTSDGNYMCDYNKIR